MKIYKKHSRHLQILNLLSAAIILITLVYVWSSLKSLPQYIQVPESLTSTAYIRINKNVIWDDIRLMVTTYLVISLICVYMQLTPFKDRSGYHKAQIISLINLSICLVFSVTIIISIKGATWL
jgi:hypothetical protein